MTKKETTSIPIILGKESNSSKGKRETPFLPEKRGGKRKDSNLFKGNSLHQERESGGRKDWAAWEVRE